MSRFVAELPEVATYTLPDDLPDRTALVLPTRPAATLVRDALPGH